MQRHAAGSLLRRRNWARAASTAPKEKPRRFNMTGLSCHSECFGTFHEGDEIVGRRSAGVERQPAPVVGQFEIRTGLTGGCIWHWPLRYSQHGRNLQVPPLRCAAQSDLRKSCRRVEAPNGRLQDLWSRNGVLGKLNDAHLQAKEAFHRRPFQWLLTDPLPEASPPRCYLALLWQIFCGESILRIPKGGFA